MADGYGVELFPDLQHELRTYRHGILPYQDIKRLVEAEQIVVADGEAAAPIEEQQLQPASIDLRLGGVAYQVRASLLPGRRRRVLEAIADLVIQKIDLAGGAVLQKGAVYVIPLLEALRLPAHTLAKANPKSTTGRLDVFVRLITDYADLFDRVGKGYIGPLFVEVAPKAFSVLVRKGTRLNQLRFLRGVSPDRDASQKAREGGNLVFGKDGEPVVNATVLSGLWFSVDLSGGADGAILGWKAAHDAPVIDLERINHYEPAGFWEPVQRQPNNLLILQPGAFYILGSKERVRVPPAYAAEMVPYDPSIGEFRVHYAGFFDPGFGYGAGDLRGTRAILEVRSHEIPYALQDGQKIGRLIYERLLAPPGKLYGADAGSSYQFQDLGLSKHFRLPEQRAAVTT